ncbi:hypothetical protein FO519_001204 [Halicephalobus sp. NKZ332]|nr:hypothetical protein FO519_001204 [Halicephalobus sp. NKZ332]
MSTSVKKKEEEKEKKFLGKLSYKLDYDFDKNALTVVVLTAEELPAMDLGGTSDPYVKLFLMPDKKKKFQTKVQRKSLNPVFNESFVFKVPYNEIAAQTLVMNVFDFDRFGKHDQIGQVSIPLGKVDLASTIEKTTLIESPPENRLGEVCLALRYVPNKNKLTVVVMECKNLKKMDVLGLSVSDYDRVGSNERIGQVIIGPAANGPGFKHWQEMLQTPRRSVAQWHTLQPFNDD